MSCYTNRLTPHVHSKLLPKKFVFIGVNSRFIPRLPLHFLSLFFVFFVFFVPFVVKNS